MDASITRRGAILTGAGAALAMLGTAGPARAARRSAALSPEQQAGQRVIFSYSGLTVPGSLLDQIAAGEAAGVIFFGDNISDLDQISGAVAQLRDAAKASPVAEPLLLMTDQEGGRIRRLPGEPELSEKQVGLSDDPVAAATDAGAGAGRLLASVGMNVNLAPVLDVSRTPGDFADQFERSYSQDPKVCARLGGAFITAQQQAGVAVTAKHFPGLGAAAADQNTDLKPVTLDVSAADLRGIDELPYGSAVAAGAKLVMLSWAVYPALDAALPAGLSPTIVRGELRGRFGFQGVTVTDAINAGALSAFGTVGNRAVTAARAGMDLILECSRSVSQGRGAVTGLAGALRNGQLGQGEFDAARARVTGLRAGLF
jgi:beta-N-acetylhexosaminidase